jgi:hypothetical protein
VFATAQPPFKSPMIASFVVCASEKKTSVNNAWPLISRRGRTSTPGWFMSIAK